MSIFTMSSADQLICDKFELYEMGSSYLITMSDGYRFISTNLGGDDLVKFEQSGAKIETLSELGV